MRCAGRKVARSDATRNFHRLQAFLMCLANPDRDGRILISAERTTAGSSSTEAKMVVTMKYMLLAPADSFRSLVEEARSVVLAGGTMAPVRLKPGTCFHRQKSDPRTDQRLSRTARTLPRRRTILDLLVRSHRPARKRRDFCADERTDRNRARVQIWEPQRRAPGTSTSKSFGSTQFADYCRSLMTLAK